MPRRSSAARTLDGEMGQTSLGASSRTVAAAAARRDLFDVALANMPHGLCMFDESKRLILCNPAYARLYDLPPDLTQPGTPLARILAFRQERGNAPAEMETYFDVVGEARSRGAHAARRIELQDGRTIQVTHNPMQGGGYVATHEDVTSHKAAEARVRHLATHDVLTDLPNRTLLSERLESTLGKIRPGALVALHCLDLDRFKIVNDMYGHAFGDRLLQAVKQRLLDCTGDADTVARLGGDEFVILQPAIADAVAARALSARVIHELAEPFSLGDHRVTIGASIGIALYPLDGLTPDVLMRNADVALYRAKLDGRATSRFFEPAMDARLQERRRLEADIREALETRAFRLHYQPLVDAASAEIRGFEALLRWSHPKRGPVAPIEFIPLAEETGLIVPIGEWALEQACQDAATWPEGVRVAVNLSPVQFKGGRLAEAVRSSLAGAGLSPSRLELEITESILLVESDANLATLHALRGMGVRIALDDFGTGYSSLSYLRSFPFDKIKIDKSFIRSMTENEGCAAIVKAVADLGTALRMTTTAEGVETQGQLDRVRGHGCAEIQGYIYAPAVPAAAALALLRSPNPFE